MLAGRTTHLTSLRRAVRVVALGALLPLGCAHQPPQQRVEPPPVAAPAIAVPAGLSPDVLAGLPPAFATPAIGVAPSDAPLFFSLRYEALSRVLDLPGLFAAHPEAFAELRDGLIQIAGKDLLSVDNLASFGVDVERPLGVFMPDASGDRAVIFLSVRDAAPILRLVTEAVEGLGEAVTTEVVEDTQLLTTAGQQAAVLVRDGVLYAVVDTASEGRRANEIARALRIIGPGDSLARLPSFEGAVKGLGADEAGLHVQPERFIPKEAEGRDFEEALFLGVLAGLDGYAFGLDAAPDGVVLAAQPSVGAESAVARILGPAGRAPTLALRLGGPRVLAQAGVTLDVPGTLRFVMSTLDADGSDQAQVEQAFKEEFGVDLMGALAPAFSGDLALTVTADPLKIFGQGSAEEALGLTFAAGVADAKPVEALLEAIAKKEAVEGARWQRATRTLTFREREGAVVRNFTARVLDGVLMVSTDAKAKPAAGAVGHATGRVRSLSEAPGLAGLGVLELILPAAFFADRGAPWREELPAARPGEAPELRAKRKELAKLEAEADKLRAELDGESGAVIREIFGRLGTLVHRVGRADGRLLLDFGLYPSGVTLAAAIRGALDGFLRLDAARESPQRKRLDGLDEQLWQLRMELSNSGAEAVE
jgi:hypothetical protein